VSGLLFALVLMTTRLHYTPPPTPAPIPNQHADLPFAFVRGEIVVTAAVGTPSVRVGAIVDTTSDGSAIDAMVADRLNLTLLDVGLAPGGSARYSTTIPSLTLGAFRAFRVAALSTDLRPISRALNRPIALILGHSFLASACVAIDYRHRRLRLANGRVPCMPSGAASIPFALDAHDNVIVASTLFGKAVRAAIDTGSNGRIALVSQLTPHRRSIFAPRSRVVSFCVAALCRKNLVVTRRTRAARDVRGYDVAVGNRFFDGATLVIDYRADRLAVIR